MEEKYFPLGNPDDKKAVRIIQIVFGAVCILMAAWWLVLSMKSELPGSVYVSIAFLFAFGTYLVLAGMGKAARFIIIGNNSLKIKKNTILPASYINAPDVASIEIYPLNIRFLLKSGKSKMLRLGTINYETNGKIVDSVISFAEANNIIYEIMEEDLQSQ